MTRRKKISAPIGYFCRFLAVVLVGLGLALFLIGTARHEKSTFISRRYETRKGFASLLHAYEISLRMDTIQFTYVTSFYPLGRPMDWGTSLDCYHGDCFHEDTAKRFITDVAKPLVSENFCGFYFFAGDEHRDPFFKVQAGEFHRGLYVGIPAPLSGEILAMFGIMLIAGPSLRRATVRRNQAMRGFELIPNQNGRMT